MADVPIGPISLQNLFAEACASVSFQVGTPHAVSAAATQHPLQARRRLFATESIDVLPGTVHIAAVPTQ
jgi:hypothetical protein